MKLTTVLVLAALAPTLDAQEVQFRGKVEDVTGTQNQFVLDCTGTELSSALFDLNPYVGQTVDITGTWNGSATAPSVLITDLAPAPETFEIGGGAKLGEVSTLGFTGQPGDLVFGFLSLDSGFQPLGGGVALIDLNAIVLDRSGVIGGAGIAQLPFGIPDQPALLGLELHGQGAIFSSGLLTLTNPDCKTIDN